MAGSVTLDTTDETITLVFVDKKGNETAAPTDIGPVTFVSSDPNIATVAAAWEPFKNQVTPTGVGTVTLSLNPLTARDGSPLLEPDGVTPFPQPDPVQLVVDAGAAAGTRLALAEEQPPAPAPSPPPPPSSPAPSSPAASTPTSSTSDTSGASPTT